MLSIFEPDWFWLCDVSEVSTFIFRHSENYPRGGLYRIGRRWTSVKTSAFVGSLWDFFIVLRV